MATRAAGRTKDLKTPARLAFALVLLSPAAAAAGFLVGPPLMLPFIAAAPAYAAMLLLLRSAARTQAVAAMLLWAGLLGASMTLLCGAMPERAERVVICGRAYW